MFFFRIRILRVEFSYVPSSFLREQLREKGKLYTAYLALNSYENPLSKLAKPYERLNKPRKIGTSDLTSDFASNDQLMGELKAAKKKAARDLGMLYIYPIF